MRFTRSAALSGLILVALVAFGIAAFTPEANAPPPTTTPVVLSEAPGRVAGAIVGASLQARAVPASQLNALEGIDPQADATDPRSTTTTAPPPATTTTTAPLSTAAAAAPATTAPTNTVPESTTTATVPETTTTTTPLPTGDNIERWHPLVATYFPAAIVDQALRVIDCESNGNPDAVGPGGASGLFQFIPSTWTHASAEAGFAGASPFDPNANVAAAAYLVQASIDSGSSAWKHWGCKP